MKKAGILAEPVLVGREKELETLHRYFESAIEGKGNTVFVSGEAGSGKTSLVNEFLDVARQKRNTNILIGWCVSNAAAPHLPFVEAFKSYFSLKENEHLENERKEVNAWLTGARQREKSGSYGSLSPEAWKDLTFAAVAEALSSISARSPTILLLEDIHWADSASLSLLHYLARATSSEKILVLTTFRSEELTVGDEGRSHPLVETLRLMKREDLFREIRLSNLSQSCVEAIAEKMVGSNLEPRLAKRLTEESRGNPLFVVESLRMWCERGSLISEEEGLHLAADNIGVPSKFRDIILRRLGMLKFSQRRVLDMASVIGEKFDPELLSFVLGQDSLDVLETLNEVAQSTSLICVEGASYRFGHARFREIFYEEIPLPLRRGYHARIAQKLESTSTNLKDLPLSSLAHHYAQAGNLERSLRYALAAGKEAQANFSSSEAIEHFSYILRTAEGAKYFDMVMEATVHLGDAYWFIGRHADALRIFEKLMDTAESGAIKLRAIHRAMQIHMRNKPAKTLELAAMAEEYAQYDLLEYAHVTMSKAMTISFEGRLEESLKLTKESLRVFVDEGAIFDAILALTFIKNYYARLDRNPFENALALVLRAVSLSKEIGDLRSLRFGLDSLAMTFLSCGLFERALETFESSLLLGKKLGGHHQTFSTSFWLSVLFETKGSIETREGNFEEATRDFERGVSYGLMGVKAAEKTDVAFSQLGGYGSLVRLYVRLADMEHAEEFYEKLEKTFEKVTSSSDPWMLAQYYRSRGVFLSAQLKWKQAVESFERSLEAFGKYRGLAFPMFIAETKIAYAAALKQEKMRKESLKQSTEAYEMVEEFLKLRARADRTNVQASIMAKGEVGIGEEFELRLDLVNVSNSSVLITKVKNLVTGDFKIVKAPTHVQLSDGGLEINARETGPFQVEPIKLTFQATKAGAFVLEPEVVYKDRLGKTESVKPAPVKVIVRQTLHARIGGEMISVPILPNRLNTGLPELDVLLYGGIPENNSVILTSQPGDERESLARCFLEAGIRAGQTTFCITTDVALAKDFADKQEKDFFLFVCNPRAEAMVQEYSNVFRIRGVENLTEIDMSLIKAFRAIDSGHIGPKRVYIEIVSDVLLQHHALTTRKWLGCFLADLKSKGFTALAAVNPNMHSKEEVQSVLSLFDGEIGISEKETSMDVRKILRVRKLHRERYLENELVLSKAILN